MIEQAGSRWPGILLIYALGVFAVAVISIAVPEAGGIAREFHPDSPAAIGWVISMPALVAALGALIVGSMVDTLGDRRILIAGGLILVAGDVGVAMSHSLSVLLGWRVVGGIGYVCMAVSAVTMMTRLTQGRQRTAALALWSTVIPASFILAFLGGSILLAPGQWRAAFGWHATLAAILLVLAVACLPARKAGEVVVARTAGIGLVLRSYWPYILGLSFAANACMQTGVIASLPAMLSGSLGVSETSVHAFNIVAMLVNVLGALGVGVLLNARVSALAIGLTGVLLCGFACLGLVFVPTGFPQAMAMNCAFMLGCGMLVGLWALLPRVAPSAQTLGATSGLITQITLVGVLFGPPVALASVSKRPSGFLVFVAVSLVGSLVGLPVWLKANSAVGQGGPRPWRLRRISS
jgi:MFS transporter, DHA1 family, inner membrane transport protein